MSVRKPRRRDFEILADILDACPDWTKPYHIFAKCSGRWTSAKKVLDDLDNKRLVEKKTVLQAVRYKNRHALSETPRARAYVLYKRTTAGSEFLHLCRLLTAMWTVKNKRVQDECLILQPTQK